MNDLYTSQDVAKYVKDVIVPKSPSLEFSMIALAGGFQQGVQVSSENEAILM